MTKDESELISILYHFAHVRANAISFSPEVEKEIQKLLETLNKKVHIMTWEMREGGKTLTEGSNYVYDQHQELSLVPSGRLNMPTGLHDLINGPRARNRVQDKNNSEEISLVSERLSKQLSKPVYVTENVFTAFKLNSDKKGKAYYISDDEFSDISIAAVQMLSNFVRHYPADNIKKGAQIKIEKAKKYAEGAYEKIQEIRENLKLSEKKPTLEAIAEGLSEDGFELSRGGLNWTATAVSRIVNRFEKPEPK